MEPKRINTVLLHTWYHFLHSMETWVDIFWSSIVNVLVFVFITKSLQHSGVDASGVSVIVGIVLWNFIWCGQSSIAIGALWEIWSRSFSTLFITPMTQEEFLVGQMISGILKGTVAVLITGTIVYVLTGYSLLSLGLPFFLYSGELILLSWSVGMLVLALIFRFGINVQSLSWGLVFLLQPLSGMFFSVSLLPTWVQNISWIIPSTYIFEGIRYQLANGHINMSYMISATVLNGLYLVVSYAVLRATIAWAKRSGAYAKMNG